MSLDEESDNVNCIFETIVNTIEPPKCTVEGDCQMLVSNIDYDEYLGRLAIGRIERGIIAPDSSNMQKWQKHPRENCQIIYI